MTFRTIFKFSLLAERVTASKNVLNACISVMRQRHLLANVCAWNSFVVINVLRITLVVISFFHNHGFLFIKTHPGYSKNKINIFFYQPVYQFWPWQMLRIYLDAAAATLAAVDFSNMFTCSFYTSRSQKRKNSVKSSVFLRFCDLRA